MVQDDLLAAVRGGRKVFLDVGWPHLTRLCENLNRRFSENFATESLVPCVYLFKWRDTISASRPGKDNTVSALYVYSPKRDSWSNEICEVCEHYTLPLGGYQADFSGGGRRGTTAFFETLSELTMALSKVDFISDELFNELSELSLGMK